LIQIQGIDYKEAFSLVVQLNSIKTLLALMATQKKMFHQLEVKMILLNGYLDEKIYMGISKVVLAPTHVNFLCKPTKSLYGLK
jgi:hypothetical protein